VHVRIEPCFPDGRLVGGKYHAASHTVFLYEEEIIEQCKLLFGSLEPLRSYIRVILAHELGHAEDNELEYLSGLLDTSSAPADRFRVMLHIEENAWRYAEALLPDIDPIFLRTIVDESLFSHRQAAEQHIA